MDDKKLAEKIRKKMKEGWIKSAIMIEVMAVTEENAKKSLADHVDKLGKEIGVVICKLEYKEPQKVEKPFKNIEFAYSYVADIELITETYEKLVFLAMNYGPSSIEILEPEEIRLRLWEAQGIVNTISHIIHRFASATGGAVTIEGKK